MYLSDLGREESWDLRDLVLGFEMKDLGRKEIGSGREIMGLKKMSVSPVPIRALVAHKFLWSNQYNYGDKKGA